MHLNRSVKAILMAILAAALFGLNAPVSKLLLARIPAALMASLLYFGAGIGMAAIGLIRRAGKGEMKEARITRKDAPYVLGMILLDAAAPISLLIGLGMTTPANAALLNNFEIVATSVIALLIFREYIGRRMWAAILLITLASALLSFENLESLTFSTGSVFILLACVCWGIENNLTRKLSSKDPQEIVVIKGLGSGVVSLVIARSLGQGSAGLPDMLAALALGFVSYGLSIYCYVLAQRELGAARTSAFYAFAPFIGVLFSVLIFGQRFDVSFVLALVLMGAGAYFAAIERHRHRHVHEALTHEHRHDHSDPHHAHAHDTPVPGEHSHVHTHERMEHTHSHTPDLHHEHKHTE